jgi:chloramphenicol 3-O-phosphotransferase
MPVLHAERAEVTWDSGKSKWLVRIHVGDEVIRRYWKAAKDTDPETLRTDAVNTARDEGYDLAADKVAVPA